MTAEQNSREEIDVTEELFEAMLQHTKYSLARSIRAAETLISTLCALLTLRI